MAPGWRRAAGEGSGAADGLPPGLWGAVLLTLGLTVLVAAAVTDRGWTFGVVVFATSAGAAGALYMLFPHGIGFALGTANGLAMYACLYVVLANAGFHAARAWAVHLGFVLPVLAFVVACWRGREGLRELADGAAPDLAHLPRFAGWFAAVLAVGVTSLALPFNRLDPGGQTMALLGAMAAIAGISARAVGDVVRLLVDMAAIFRAVLDRVVTLAVPIAAYASLWALLTVVFGSLYRIADGLSRVALFGAADGPLRLSFTDAMHFSVVTLSSVGYGDIRPTDEGVRVLASMQMLAAQLLLLFGFYEIMRGSGAGDPAAVAEAAPDPGREPATIAADAGDGAAVARGTER